MLDAKQTLHFHSIGVRDRIVFLCSSFEFYRSHTFRSERNIRLERIFNLNIFRLNRNYFCLYNEFRSVCFFYDHCVVTCESFQ